jgi:NAD(P)-dependent dehydrogenase (short-subunit alcohol dehydrogenase family)
MSALDCFSLNGQVVVVTGAGKGIGRGIALDAAASGATVIGCSRTQADLTSLETEVAALSAGDCKTIVADITTLDGLESVYDFAERTSGRINGVVNNAGVNVLRDAIDYSEEEVDMLFTLNLKSVYWSCVIAARRMLKAGTQGAIVNITSQAAVAGAPGRAPYSAAKAGVNHLSRSLAAEWAQHGIRINALAPTVTATPLGIRAMEQRPEFAAEVARRIALRGRAATVEEISRPALFLLSPAASLITGQTLVVDGGWTL